MSVGTDIHSKKVTVLIHLRAAFFCHICSMNTNYTKHFLKSEFASKDGASTPVSCQLQLVKLCKVLEIIRLLLGAAINVTSGYRSPSHNRAEGRAKNSYHMKGMAVDFWVKGFTPQFIARLLKYLSSIGLIPKGGIHAYDTFVHYDIRGYSARW